MYGVGPTKYQPDGITKAVLTDEAGYGRRRTTTVRFSNAEYSLVDDAGNGGVLAFKIYDFPEGVIIFEGAVIDVTQTRVAVDGDTAGLSTTFDGDVGLGTTVGVSPTLATTEQDFVPTTSVTQAVGGVARALAASTTVSGATGAPRLIDGSATAVDMYLNFLIDDADQDATGHPVNIRLDGYVTFNWTLIGDK